MSDKCKVCGERTDVVFNIALKAVSVCEGCAWAITCQQVVYAKTEWQTKNALASEDEEQK